MDENTPADWSLATRNSYEAACGRQLQEHIQKGGAAHAGQWGQTVIQYPDYYVIGSGLGWARNSGQWTPKATFSGKRPEMPGAEGTILFRERDGRPFEFKAGAWRDLYPFIPDNVT